MTHISVGKLTIIGSDNGLSPERRQAIIWTNAGILLIKPLQINFSEILIEIQTFSLKKICFKMSSAKCCSFCLGLNVLIPMGCANETWLPLPHWDLDIMVVLSKRSYFLLKSLQIPYAIWLEQYDYDDTHQSKTTNLASTVQQSFLCYNLICKMVRFVSYNL